MNPGQDPEVKLQMREWQREKREKASASPPPPAPVSPNPPPPVSIPRRELTKSQSEALRRFVSQREVRLSWAVAGALNIAAEEAVASPHSQNIPMLDCQKLFFAFLSVGFEDQNAKHAPSSLPLDLLASLEIDQRKLADAKQEYFRQVATVENFKIQEKEPQFLWDEMFDRLWTIAAQIKYKCSPRRPYLAARHLLAAFIQISVESKNSPVEIPLLSLPLAIESLIKNCSIYERGDSRKGWADFFVKYAPDQFKNGQTQDFNREGDEKQAALRVDDYASTFAQFFKSAGNEECCLAVFAPWGRGKSYLMKRVKTMLQPFSYVTVSFQAWRYPTRPEVWVHLYETMCRSAFDCSWWQRWPRIFRVGIARHGFGHLIWALLIIGLALYPKVHLADQAFWWIQTLVKILGIGSVIWIVTFFFSAVKSAKKLSKEYLVTPNHSEKLGLQATIGDDLAALLEGWMPSKRWPGFLPVIAFAASVWLIFEGAAHWGSFAPSGLLAGTWGVGDVLPWIASGALVMTAAWLMSWFGEPKRILLVVDDLDRCSMEHLISVMESVKLLIEDKNVSQRLQVAMLVEEEVLKHAILHKYAPVRHSNGGSMSDDRIIRESCEKLFTVHLRLDPLTADDAEEVLSRMFGASKPESRNNEEEVSDPDSTDPTDANSDRQRDNDVYPVSQSARATSNTGEAIASRTNKQGSTTKNNSASNKKERKMGSAVQQSLPNFSFIEEEVLKSAVRDLVDARGDDVVGPRSVRNFVFRYQLARLLLNQLKVPFESGILVEALASAMTNGRKNYNLREEILRVVKQIS